MLKGSNVLANNALAIFTALLRGRRKKYLKVLGF
jgi:hypothetical protein